MREKDLAELIEMLPPAYDPSKGAADSVDLRYKCAEVLWVWLRIRELEGHPMPVRTDLLAVEMQQSALLPRLFKGHPPLLNPPPLRFAHPWYNLIEDGFGMPNDVAYQEGRSVVFIDREPWALAGLKRGEDDFLVEHPRAEGKWRVWSTGAEKNGSLLIKRWRLERLERCEGGSP